MNLAAPAIRVDAPRPALSAARADATRRVSSSPRVPRMRRAAIGCAWALAWTVVWGLAIEIYSHRAQAAPAATVVARPATHPAVRPGRTH